MRIQQSDISALARGCALFGGGGGGEPTIGELMASAALDGGRHVDLVDIADLPGDGLVLPVALIGAPTVGVEKLPRGDEGLRLREICEQTLGREVVAFISGELGGINGVAPVAWAAHAGVPLVDGDLIGRAFPGLQFTLPGALGIDPSPVVLIDERGNTATFDVVNADWANRYAVAAMIASGAVMAMSVYPMPAAQAATATVHGSVSRAIRAGRLLREHTDDPVGALCAEVDGVDLFRGKVVDIDRRTEGGYTMGSAVIEGTGNCAGRLMRLEFQNENLVAMVDGAVIASVPDIITVLDLYSAWPIVTEALRYGQRVAVVGVPCAPQWREAAGLRLVGARAFGYDIDYRPVEDAGATTH